MFSYINWCSRSSCLVNLCRMNALRQFSICSLIAKAKPLATHWTVFDPRMLLLSIIQNVRAYPKEVHVCYVPWYCLPIPGCTKRGEGELLCWFRFDFDLFYCVSGKDMLWVCYFEKNAAFLWWKERPNDQGSANKGLASTILLDFILWLPLMWVWTSVSWLWFIPQYTHYHY